ncbi:MAG: tetratricopeptide repeat-containing sulfotransferase family protein, partial [Gammaproteobacteria bacterium]
MAETTPNLTPAQAQARRQLQHGMHCLEAGDLQAAANALLQAVRLDDMFALAHYQLGNCLRRYGDNARAEQALLAAIEQDAALNDAYISLAYLYHEGGRDHDAGLILDKLRATHPDDVGLGFQLGGLLVKFGLFAGAERVFANCPPSDARQAQAQLTLGNAYQAAGQFEQAQQAFLKAIDLKADSDAAYLRIAHTRHFGSGDSAMAEKFERILSQPDLSPATHVCLHFSLGKIYDDLASYDQAFEHYRRGNELQHAQIKFDRGQLLDYSARCKQVFTAEFLRSAAATPARATPQPIFVIGMLRSGTTLVERILASHPECYGLGETELVDALTRDLAAQTGKDYPECARGLTPALCTRHAAALRSAWPAPARRLAHVIDKNPLNFLHLGLINVLFPGAPVVHCVRDPLDTCLSIYFQHFAHPRNTYAYALDDIAFFYRQYRDLMAYWRQVLPAPPYDVRYEELVRKPDQQVRALVAAAGLEWDPACLESHKHTERIETASAWQARQPIYSASAGRWRRYARHLDDL